MAYRKAWRDQPDVPAVCPCCDLKREDAAAIATHNIKAATDGCRVYPRPTWRPYGKP